MRKQKVITVNVNSADIEKTTGHKEIELTTVNKYLDEGWYVVDKFSTVSNAKNLYCVNLTFILEREE
jgi:hypothetical protein